MKKDLIGIKVGTRHRIILEICPGVKEKNRPDAGGGHKGEQHDHESYRGGCPWKKILI